MTVKLQGFPLFVFLLIGQLGALLGTTVTNFALGLWAYEKAGSVGDFTWIGVAATLPALVLGPFIGVLVDRMQRKPLLVLAQAGSVSIIAILTYLYVHDLLSVWWIICVVPIGSIFGVALQVGFTSTVTSVVGKSQLNQANGLIGLAFGLIQLGGPLLGAVAMDHSTLEVILYSTLVAYVVGLLTIAISKIPLISLSNMSAEKPTIISDLKDGYSYLRDKKGLLGGLWLFTVVWFCVSVVQILFVPVILGIGTKTDLGLVQTLGGLGLLLGGVLMVVWKGPQRLAYGIAFPCFTLGIGFTFMPISTSIMVLGVVSLLIMMTIPIANAASQTLWQRKTAPAFQGRVFALRNTIMKAAQPLAFLAAGYLADMFFEPAMKTGGVFSGTVVADIWGEGSGRGSALMMSVFGLISFFVVLIGFMNPVIRRSDIELQDYEDEKTEIDQKENF